MNAHEFIEKLVELLEEYHTANKVIICDIELDPTAKKYKDGTLRRLKYNVKFKVRIP